MAKQFAPQRAMLFRNWVVAVHTTPLPDGRQGPGHPILGRLAPDNGIPPTRLAPIMREAKKVEGPRSTTTAATTRRSRAPERDESGLLRVEIEPVLRESLREHLRYPTRVVLPSKDEDGIVRKADEGSRAPHMRLHDILEPLVQNLVEVDVREQR